jgi:hypothetical protein
MDLVEVRRPGQGCGGLDGERVTRHLERAPGLNCFMLADPLEGYALMRAALSRGIQFPAAADLMAEARSELDAQQVQVAENLAIQFANRPSFIPMP